MIEVDNNPMVYCMCEVVVEVTHLTLTEGLPINGGPFVMGGYVIWHRIQDTLTGIFAEKIERE